jgi:ferredoxin
MARATCSCAKLIPAPSMCKKGRCALCEVKVFELHQTAPTLDLLRIEGDRRGTLKIETRRTFLV